MAEFCERLKLLREEHHLTQGELGQVIDLKVRAYQLYEHGDGYPTYARLIALADYFDVSLDYLVGRSDMRERR